MSRIEADVALLTERRFEAPSAAEGDWYHAKVLREDHLLAAALADVGLSSVRVDWSRPDVDWSKFRCAVFRTTWDYSARYAEFTVWLKRIESQTRLCNDASIIWWNLDKHYLADLEARGIPVVPSRYLERGSTTTLHGLLDATGWEEGAIKPCVSCTARHTYRVSRSNAGELDSVVQSILAGESLMFQPFVRDVARNGEDTLVVIGGHFTHAVRKVPRAGDFRVQDSFGGTVQPLDPSAEQIDLAQRAMSSCQPAPSYGRVDMVRDNDGRLAVMELELIEPELWLRENPVAASALAAAIARAAG